MKHDIKFSTSLYNHGTISDGVKPLIANDEYKALLNSVRAGDYQPYYEAKEVFCFEPKQEKLILDIINKLIL